MNGSPPSIINVIDSINNLSKEIIKEHAPELYRMLSNLLDDHKELITGLDLIWDKLEKHHTEIEQFQIFADKLTEQKKQHLSLEELMESISVHLTGDELSHIEENSVKRQETNETVKAIMEKYKELMEEKE